MSFLRDLRIAMRSLGRVRALWITVALTLALGIGANAAIFSVVRAVLLRPLANRDEDRLLYLRQSAPGHWGGEHDVLDPGDRRSGQGAEDDQETGNVFGDRLHDPGAGYAAGDSGWSGGRELFRGDGTAADSGTAAGSRRRWAERDGRGGADV